MVTTEKKEILFERFEEFSVSDFQSKKSLVLSMGVENSIIGIELIR